MAFLTSEIMNYLNNGTASQSARIIQQVVFFYTKPTISDREISERTEQKLKVNVLIIKMYPCHTSVNN